MQLYWRRCYCLLISWEDKRMVCIVMSCFRFIYWHHVPSLVALRLRKSPVIKQPLRPRGQMWHNLSDDCYEVLIICQVFCGRATDRESVWKKGCLSSQWENQKLPTCLKTKVSSVAKWYIKIKLSWWQGAPYNLYQIIIRQSNFDPWSNILTRYVEIRTSVTYSLSNAKNMKDSKSKIVVTCI